MKEKIKKFFKFQWMSKRFWIRVFLFQIFCVVSLKLFGISYMTDTFVLGAMGFIATIIGLSTMDKKVTR